jgi:hypothetical protein
MTIISVPIWISAICLHLIYKTGTYVDIKNNRFFKTHTDKIINLINDKKTDFFDEKINGEMVKNSAILNFCDWLVPPNNATSQNIWKYLTIILLVIVWGFAVYLVIFDT